MAVQRGNVLAVVGAQYGSEGKGVIVSHLADRFEHHVRVGGPNAGHSLNHNGRVFKMQTIPCGWINPDAALYIGRGGLVNVEILTREIDMLTRAGVSLKDRLFIDANCGVLSEWHHAAEGGTKGDIHKRIGSTGEGVGAAREARIGRDTAYFKFFWQIAESDPLLSPLVADDVGGMLRGYLDQGENVLLEGTQGSALSLIHGPWPYVTSADTNAAQMAVDVGIPPRYVNRTMLVARTFPIRVAGNSGPLENEITWDELSREIGKPVEERTTVTKKVRRIGRWDEDLFLRGVALNAPTSLALTFADYLDMRSEGRRVYKSLTPPVQLFVDYLERLTDVPVALVGTGGSEWAVCDRGIAP